MYEMAYQTLNEDKRKRDSPELAGWQHGIHAAIGITHQLSVKRPPKIAKAFKRASAFEFAPGDMNKEIGLVGSSSPG